MNCVSYDPFSDPFYHETTARQAIENTLQIISNKGFKCIRTYNSQYYGIDIATYAQKYNLKLVLGVRWGESWTHIEVSTAVASCQKYPNAIIGIYPTNTQTLSDAGIALGQIRANDGCAGVPFGIVLSIDSYLNIGNIEPFWDVIDWLGFSEFPFEKNVTNLSTRDYLKQQINKLRINFDGKIYSKFRLVATGWPSDGMTQYGNVASVSKAKEYADYFAQMLCAGEFKTSWVSYFEFFDATYKKIDEAKSYEKHYGLAFLNETTKAYEPKWDIGNLHC